MICSDTRRCAGQVVFFYKRTVIKQFNMLIYFDQLFRIIIILKFTLLHFQYILLKCQHQLFSIMHCLFFFLLLSYDVNANVLTTFEE